MDFKTVLCKIPHLVVWVYSVKIFLAQNSWDLIMELLVSENELLQITGNFAFYLLSKFLVSSFFRLASIFKTVRLH